MTSLSNVHSLFNKKCQLFFKSSKEFTLVVKSGKDQILDLQNGKHCAGER